MFILINNIPYNSFSISSFAKQTRVITDNFGNDSFIYAIVFELNNGTVLVEDYSTEQERNASYNNLLRKLTGEDVVEEYPTNQTGEEVTLDETSNEQENEAVEDTSENIE